VTTSKNVTGMDGLAKPVSAPTAVPVPPAKPPAAEPWTPFFTESPAPEQTRRQTAPMTGDEFWEAQAQLNAPEFFPRQKMPWDADS
jgi:hypothetical protein